VPAQSQFDDLLQLVPEGTSTFSITTTDFDSQSPTQIIAASRVEQKTGSRSGSSTVTVTSTQSWTSPTVWVVTQSWTKSFVVEESSSDDAGHENPYSYESSTSLTVVVTNGTQSKVSYSPSNTATFSTGFDRDNSDTTRGTVDTSNFSSPCPLRPALFTVSRWSLSRAASVVVKHSLSVSSRQGSSLNISGGYQLSESSGTLISFAPVPPPPSERWKKPSEKSSIEDRSQNLKPVKSAANVGGNGT
jgi:hypothetical protein